ncbi:AMP-binding enzyme/AMP-binding enzyme C-terminal domain containing protein, putative [Angomonas deanei]|uniref:AMP-binding enzyme/AMP-binding enzyme C-terminal domain containing protein, putative n=1 Tax=Angomonas deanei TaxID=59799 RepID=A0A7G2CFV9_9TRYP|nr:AMP-binding enzyme/AMP-binding enzyme C-terminal domain containing protein, putative [Angomonas deanei]
MMKGYLDKEQTDIAIQDGWYRTGDMGYIGKRKEFRVSGRLKELIKHKGFQVSPPEVEAELIKHPWVQDCIVIGANDPRDVSFENPRALVVLKPDLPTKDAVRASDEIHRYMMRKMPPHKRLHGGVRIVESIMKNASRKVDATTGSRCGAGVHERRSRSLIPLGSCLFCCGDAEDCRRWEKRKCSEASVGHHTDPNAGFYAV